MEKMFDMLVIIFMTVIPFIIKTYKNLKVVTHQEAMTLLSDRVSIIVKSHFSKGIDIEPEDIIQDILEMAHEYGLKLTTKQAYQYMTSSAHDISHHVNGVVMSTEDLIDNTEKEYQDENR